MEETLRKLVQAIIKEPEEIVIDSDTSESGKVVFTIHLSNEENKGVVIGKGGRTIKALSDIMGVKGIKHNMKVVLKVA